LAFVDHLSETCDEGKDACQDKGAAKEELKGRVPDLEVDWPLGWFASVYFPPATNLRKGQ
jgi:hypothetical protein